MPYVPIAPGAWQQAQKYAKATANAPYVDYYQNVDDPVVKFLYAADTRAADNIFRAYWAGLQRTAAPAGSKAGNLADHVQKLLRSKGFSKGKSQIGILDPKDIPAFKSVMQVASNSNVDWIAYLEAYGATSDGQKKFDTTPRYSKQISTALQYKDATDASTALNKAYFLAYNVFPEASKIEDFKTKWNLREKAEKATTTSEAVTTFEVVKDAKGNVVKNPITGQPVYKTITKTDTVTSGEGFTKEEQDQFMADYLKTNYNITQENIGGAAKAIYDDIANTYRKNYLDIPSFDEIVAQVSDIIGTGDATVSEQKLLGIKNTIRKMASKKISSLAEDLLAGEDAATFVEPVIKAVNELLETTVDYKDPLIQQIFNFKDEKGNVRVANDFEISALARNDSRFGKTAYAKNEAISGGDALMRRLGR